MPMIEVSETTYQQLLALAAIRQMTVENLAVELIQRPAPVTSNGNVGAQPQDLPYDEWKKLFDEWQTRVQARVGNYPPGFECDVSRESMYEGCGE